jgi:hypothetical protein
MPELQDSLPLVIASGVETSFALIRGYWAERANRRAVTGLRPRGIGRFMFGGFLILWHYISINSRYWLFMSTLVS